jgi:hypothetical protein
MPIHHAVAVAVARQLVNLLLLAAINFAWPCGNLRRGRWSDSHMHHRKALGGVKTDNCRTGRGNRDSQVGVRKLLAPGIHREERVAGVTIVVVTDTHDDKQEYAEDGDHDHEDEYDHDNGTFKSL